MNQIIRYYNQNRKKIWGIVIIIASAILLLQLVNYYYKVENQKRLEGTNQIQRQVLNTNTTKVTDDQSVVTGKQIAKNDLEIATKIIDTFISYCNEQDIEKAYDLLTEDCKSQMYNNIEDFEQAYYNNVFERKQKIGSIENWHNNTYKVKIMEDMLSTGRKEENPKQDYITVVKENNENKLNINGYIGKEDVNKTIEKDNIKVRVINRNTYKDYETYTVEVTNYTENSILLDGRSNVKSLYIQDSKNVKYSSYSHELTEPMLTVNPKDTRELTIKFYSSFSSTKKIEAIVFSDVLLKNGQLTEKTEIKVKI